MKNDVKQSKLKKLIRGAGLVSGSAFAGMFGLNLPQLLDEMAAEKKAKEEENNNSDTASDDSTSNIDKPTLSALSGSLTNLTAQFKRIDAYTKNIDTIYDHNISSKESVRKEDAIEGNLGPTVSRSGGDSGGYLASRLPEITAQIDELTAAINANGIGTGTGTGQQQNTGGGLGAAATAAAVGALVVGGSAMASSQAQAAPAPAANTAAVKEQQQSTNRQANAVKVKTDAEEKRRQDIAEGRLPSTGIGAGLATWLGNTFRGVSEFIRGGFSSLGEAGGNFIDDAAYNMQGASVNDNAGIIYHAAKDRGYDDYMAIAMVSLAQKESGLRPRPESMNYSEARAREVFGARAPSPHITDPRAFANHVYAGRNGNTGPDDGWRYRGRGFNQLTGLDNYRRVGRIIGQDLVGNPDALNNPGTAAEAFFAYYEGNGIMRKTARSQLEANRIVTDATGGREGFSSASAFGRENLARVNAFSRRYSPDRFTGADTPFSDESGYTEIGSDLEAERIPPGASTLGILSQYNINTPDHVSGLHGPFAHQMAGFLYAGAQAGQTIKIFSGYRSIQRQSELYRAAVIKYGSEAAARRWVAPPGRSRHNFGLAVDLKYGTNLDSHGNGSQSARASKMWAHTNASRFGLTFPMNHEPWHIEPTGARAAADQMRLNPREVSIGPVGGPLRAPMRSPIPSLGAPAQTTGGFNLIGSGTAPAPARNPFVRMTGDDYVNNFLPRG